MFIAQNISIDMKNRVVTVGLDSNIWVERKKKPNTISALEWDKNEYKKIFFRWPKVRT
jgi:hypothetical protein